MQEGSLKAPLLFTTLFWIPAFAGMTVSCGGQGSLRGFDARERTFYSGIVGGWRWGVAA